MTQEVHKKTDKKRYYFKLSYFWSQCDTFQRNPCDIIWSPNISKATSSPVKGTLILGSAPSQKNIHQYLKTSDGSPSQEIVVFSCLQDEEYLYVKDASENEYIHNIFHYTDYLRAYQYRPGKDDAELIPRQTNDREKSSLLGQATLFRVPFKDGSTNITFSLLDQAVDKAYNKVEGGDSVWIHCKAGIGRSVYLAAATLLKHSTNFFGKQYTPYKVLDYLHKKRPQMRRDPKFYDALCEYAQYLNKKLKLGISLEHKSHLKISTLRVKRYACLSMETIAIMNSLILFPVFIGNMNWNPSLQNPTGNLFSSFSIKTVLFLCGLLSYLVVLSSRVSFHKDREHKTGLIRDFFIFLAFNAGIIGIFISANPGHNAFAQSLDYNSQIFMGVGLIATAFISICGLSYLHYQSNKPSSTEETSMNEVSLQN